MVRKKSYIDFDEIINKPLEDLLKLEKQVLAEALVRLRDFVYDPVTGLKSKKEFSDVVADIIPEKTTFVLFDVDHFKKINDTHGHEVGDQVLKHIGALFMNFYKVHRPHIIRVGGDEFLFIFEKENLEVVKQHAENIRSFIENNPPKVNLSSGEQLLKITVSAGISFYDGDPLLIKDKTRLFNEADIALYKSKIAGKNKVSLFNPNN